MCKNVVEIEREDLQAIDGRKNQGCGSGSGSGLDPDSEDFVDPDPYWESGSRGK
jgi:hypothetical protein